MLAAESEVVRRQRTRFAERKQAIDALALGVTADFIVELPGHVADFAHVAEHQNLLADG